MARAYGEKDIPALIADVNPKARSLLFRIVSESSCDRTERLSAPVLNAVRTLAEGANARERSHLIRLLRSTRAIDEREVRIPDVEALYEILSSSFLPQLIATVKSYRKLKVLNRSRTAILEDCLKKWNGEEVLEACMTILDIEGIRVFDRKNRYAAKALDIVEEVESALLELDKFVSSLPQVKGEEQRSIMFFAYWDTVVPVESALTDLLEMIGLDKFDYRDDPSRHHSLRIVGRYAFDYYASNGDSLDELLRAYRSLCEGEVGRAELTRALRSTLKAAATSRQVSFLYSVSFCLCELISKRRVNALLPSLKIVALRVQQKGQNSYFQDQYPIELCFIRVILDLERVSSRDEANPYAKRARQLIRKYSKEVDKQGFIMRNEDSLARSQEEWMYDKMKQRLREMRNLLNQSW